MAIRGINKVIILSNLGQEPEIRYMPNVGAVANLSLATSASWRDKQTGEIRENTEWHRVVLFGKLADVASEYLHKGSQVYIEGQLRTRNWQDDSRVTRYVTEIVINQNGTMQMPGGCRDAGQQQNVAPQQSAQPAGTPKNSSAQTPSQQIPQPSADDYPLMDDNAPY